MHTDATISLPVRIKAKFTLLAVFAIAGFLQSGPIMAQDQEKPVEPWEKGALKIGGFISAFDSSLQFGIKQVAGIKIDGESVLGLDSTLALIRGNAMIRPGKSRRHQFDLDVASYHRHGSGVITEEIVIDDETLVPGTQIDSILNFDIIRGTYSYALLQDDRMRLALGLGVYVVPLEYGIDITTTTDNRVLEYRDVTLPLPSFAFRADFQLIPKLFLTTEINAMYLEIDQFTGSLLDTSIGLEYRPWKHLGIGAAYSTMSVYVESEESSDYPGADFVGAVDVNFTGLMLYAKFTF